MKKFVPIIFACFLGACATNQAVVAPSTAAVKSHVNQASGSVNAAKAASQSSSTHIKEFKNDAQEIDFKASKALELL